MDLAVVKTKAYMSPTPGQIEQEYLGDYHTKKGTFYSVNQDYIDLNSDVEIAKKTTGIKIVCNVDKTTENIINVVYNVNKSPFI